MLKENFSTSSYLYCNLFPTSGVCKNGSIFIFIFLIYFPWFQNFLCILSVFCMGFVPHIQIIYTTVYGLSLYWWCYYFIMWRLTDFSMERDEDNDVAGSIPESGAIFMSNIATKKECFKCKVFGLPSSLAEFVRQVRAGMILFLFEYEKRELFGVYQACSDGAMDIVPHLCKNLGMRFPAQVHFRPIWYCNPLSEKEFREAIYDNYYSAKKFNFGLSEDQVHRLVFLFSSRKLKNKLPRQPLTKLVNKAVGDERRLIDDDRFALVKKAYMRRSKDDFIEPGMSGDYLGNLLNRSKEPEDDEFNSVAHGSLTGYSSECPDRRADNDGRLLRNDLLKNRLHDDRGTLGSFRFGSLEDTFDKVRRLADGGQLLTGEVVNDKFRVDGDLDSIHFKEYPVGLLDVKADDDDKINVRNRTVGGYDMDNCFGSAFSTERHGKFLYRSRFGINDDRFLIGDHGEKEYNHHHTIEPVGSNVGSLDERLENRHGMDCISSPDSASESLGSLHKIRKATGDRWFAMNERIGSEANLGSHLGPGFSTEKFVNPLNSGCRSINDAKISKSEGRVSENIVDNIRFSTTLNKNSGYVTNVGGRISDDGRFRNDNHVEIGEAIDTFARPVFSTKFTSLSKMKQNSLVYPNSPHSTHHDTTDVPYIPEVTRSPHQRYSSFAANGNSSSVQETPCHGSGGNHYFLSKTGSPAYGLEAEGSSRHLDVASAYGNKAVLPTISDHPSKYFLNADLSNHVDMNSSAYLDYRSSSFPNPSSASLPAMRSEIFERDKGSGSYTLNSMEDPNSGKSGNFSLTLGGMYQHIIYPEVDKTLAGQDFLNSEKQDPSLDMYHHEEDSLNCDKDFKSSKENIISYEEHHRHSKAPSKDSNSNRRSVFTRLTSGPVAQVQEEEENSNNYVYYDECYMDSSVSEVMGLLHQGLNKRVREGKKLKRCKPFHSGCNYESGLDERRAFVDRNIEVDQSMTTRYMKDVYGAIDENINEELKETRAVDFKRRSETKRKLIETSTKSNPSVAEGMISLMDAEVDRLAHKSCKRRKLVRPIFTKNDSVDEGVVSNPSDNCETVLNAPEAKMLNPDTGLSKI